MDDQHDQFGEDMDLDDEMLLAIALSMEQDQPGEPNSNQGQAAGPAAPAPAPAPRSDAAVQAAQLQQALMQLIQQQNGVQAPRQQQRAAQPSPEPSCPKMPKPTWVEAASKFPAASPVPADLILSTDLLQPQSPLDVAFSAGMGFSLAAAVQRYPLTAGKNTMTWDWAKAAAERVSVDGNVVLSLQHSWQKLAPSSAAPTTDSLSSALSMLRHAVALRAKRTLEEDEDDLFFEGGSSMVAFHEALRNGQILPAFLDNMITGPVAEGAERNKTVKFWTDLIKNVFKKVDSLSLSDTASFEPILRALDVLTQSDVVKEATASMLVGNADFAAHYALRSRGKEFEDMSFIAPLLSFSAFPVLDFHKPTLVDFPAKKSFEELRGYPRNRGSHVESEINSIRANMQRIYTAAHEILKRVATIKTFSNSAAASSKKGGKEVLGAWLAGVIAVNVGRSEAGSYLDEVLRHKSARKSSSDAFLLATTATTLRFCRPFMATAEKKQGALVHLDPKFNTKYAYRLAGVSKERTLAATLPEQPEGAVRPFPCFSPDQEDPPHFVAEMFFATQRLIRVGLVPAIYKFQAVAKHLRRKRMAGAAEEDNDDDFVNEESRGASVEEWLLLDSVRAILLDPVLGNDLVQFCELTARWILNLLQKNAAQGTAAIEITSLIPESAVRDICTVLEYLIRQNASELLGGADISSIMSCFSTCLRATDAIPSPAVHASIVQCLVTMLSSQFYSGRRRRIPSPAESALVSAVLGTTALQKELLPALMAAYVQADHVVGLDVDKDAYDKFTMRTQIDILLMELWRDPACARSLDAVAAAATASDGKDAALFSDFCGAVLNDLIYLLKDSLGRLEDIATLERSMADKQAWEAQSKPERDGKMQFYQSQQRTVSGFLSMALTSLKMLNTLVASRTVQIGFVGEEIAHKSAGAAFHFIDLLVGPRCGDLAVLKNPMQYHFDPDMLLINMLQFTLRLGEQSSFVVAMAEVPDYEAAVLNRTAEILKEKQLGEYEYRARLEGLVAAVGHCLREKEKQQAAGGDLAAAGSAELEREAEEASAAAIEEAYKNAVGLLAVGEFDATLPHGYNRHFAAMAETAAGDVSKAAKRISRELRDFNGKMTLPIYAGGAILVRYDQERLDKVRALITGPEGTPYEGGCYFFDVFFPAQYPQTPPLLELETTGGGVARFNPNLYADGKVCLSLLGTWHGGSASEKWNPSTSTLWQVLVSIQSQVLVPEPYYNEPAYGAMRGSIEGDSASLKYNAEIWLSNMRYAIIDVLKHPRPGFEQAIVEHFKALRPRLVKRMATWVESAETLGPAMQSRLERAAAEVRSLLASL